MPNKKMNKMKATIYISSENKPINIATELGNISASVVNFTSTEIVLKVNDDRSIVMEVEDFYSLIIDGESANISMLKPDTKFRKKDLKVGQKVFLTNGCTAKINYIGYKPKDRHKQKITYVEFINLNPPLALFPDNKVWLSIDEAVDNYIKEIID